MHFYHQWSLLPHSQKCPFSSSTDTCSESLSSHLTHHSYFNVNSHSGHQPKYYSNNGLFLTSHPTVLSRVQCAWQRRNKKRFSQPHPLHIHFPSQRYLCKRAKKNNSLDNFHGLITMVANNTFSPLAPRFVRKDSSELGKFLLVEHLFCSDTAEECQNLQSHSD